MTNGTLIVQRPALPSQLVLLLHGVGSSARDLAPLGEALAPHLPSATIVSLQAPEAVGPGWQWFSVHGVTEADRAIMALESTPLQNALAAHVIVVPGRPLRCAGAIRLRCGTKATRSWRGCSSLRKVRHGLSKLKQGTRKIQMS